MGITSPAIVPHQGEICKGLPEESKTPPFTKPDFSCKIEKTNREEKGESPLKEYVLHLPEEESILLSGAAARRLLDAGDGDAALLYIAIRRARGAADDEGIRGQIRWPQERFARALAVLTAQGLVSIPGGPLPAAEAPPPSAGGGERPEYTRSDMARALEGGEFAGLTRAVEGKLGKKLTTPDLSALLGLYDYLGLPADVIFLLVGFCCERTAAGCGAGRRPTLRQIEREGYLWARKGLFTQESAAAYIRKVQAGREKLPRLMKLLGLGDRAPSPSEERYLLSWIDMGFGPEAVALAYDKTVLKCRELKWPYLNKILQNWHQKGLHTPAEISEGDRLSTPRPAAGRPPREEDAASIRENLARMEKYRRKLRQGAEEK